VYGQGNVVVSAGVNLTLRQQNLSSGVDYSALPTGTRIGTVAPLAPDLGVDQRKPVNLTLRAANILLDKGARIETDPGAAITFGAAPTTTSSGSSTQVSLGPAANVLLLGSILDHSGTVTVNASHIWFGSQANIDLSGTAVANSGFGMRNATGLSSTFT